ncbi:EAL domain-containing protein [Psychrobacillus sp. L4]|uniref:EAL domain-containing protein n=1 Tax=Psychrobacillus sp. L4 TaxID=3236892 RepID=UPI0036F28C7E
MELQENFDLLFRSFYEHNPDAIFLLNTSGDLVHSNEIFPKLFGYSAVSEVRTVESMLPLNKIPLYKKAFYDSLTHNPQNIDIEFIHKNGHTLNINLTMIPTDLDKNFKGIIGIAKDISNFKKAENLNKYLASYDSLTELPNRRHFVENLDKHLIISRTLNQKLAIMYLDLDRFKYINDTLGHAIGDKLLEQISKRLQICVGGDVLVARIVGDEFGILLPNLQIDQIIEYSKTIIKALEEPFYIEKYHLFVTTCIGISVYPNDGEDSQSLLKNASSAVNRAKEMGNNNYQVFTSSMNAQTYKIFSLESSLRYAIEQNELEMYYQAKVSTKTNQIIGAEALIRWNHPEWGILTPDEFIPLAEETGIITEIGKWVTHTVCLQNKAWQDANLPAIPISINLSANRFLEKNLIIDIKKVLEETNLDPSYLEIEITETSLLENEKHILSILDELRSIGIKIAMDDFGTGYSSLSTLRQFKDQIDTLKIDRTFIQNLSQSDKYDMNFFTNMIIQLSQHLNMDVVAEGVETSEQLEILHKYNCGTIQGFIFSKPIPADQFETLLMQDTLEPIENIDSSEEVPFEDQREFFRVNLEFPLSANMTLIRIRGKKVEIGNTLVLIEDIGLGGLRFLSDIKLATNQDIILEFETEILGNMIKFYGSIVWMKSVKSNIFQYGIKFAMDENERSLLTQLLNKFAILLRKSPLLPECSFIKVDRYNFFKQKEKNKKTE